MKSFPNVVDMTGSVKVEVVAPCDRRLTSTHDNITQGLKSLHGLSLSGGFTPCRHLRPSSEQEHTIV